MPGGPARRQLQPAAADQFSDRGLLDRSVVIREPDRRPRRAQHHPRPAIDDDAIPGPYPFLPGMPGHLLLLSSGRHVIDVSPSRTDRSQLSSRRHSKWYATGSVATGSPA